MANLDTIDSAACSAAERRALANFAANLTELASTQPRLSGSVEHAPRDLEYVFGRDGYLTAFDEAGHWWSGCSLPRRANEAMLKSLSVHGPISCLLAPPHAASIRVALDMTGPAHAIIAAVPDLLDLAVLLACDDFSHEIRQHRLWFAWGSNWAEELDRLFDERTGLATPTQFIRLPVTEADVVEPMIAAAQGVFSATGTRRSAIIDDICRAWSPRATQSLRICVLTSRQFALWDDAAYTIGAALGSAAALAPSPGTPGEGWGEGHFSAVQEEDPHPALSRSTGRGESLGGPRQNAHVPQPSPGVPRQAGIGTPGEGEMRMSAGIPPGRAEIVRLLLDEPLHASPLAMLSAAVDCDAMVTADLARADLPGVLPRELPWITWLTMPRVPPFAAAGPHDVLLAADPSWRSRAIDAGWPEDRVVVARWPDLGILAEDRDIPRIGSVPSHSSSLGVGDANARGHDELAPVLAIIADTCGLDAPAQLDDFSSHRLLWNSIRPELESDPLILTGVDPGEFLDERIARFGVSTDGLDRRLFANELIVPCYGQGIARLLRGAGMPLRLFGRGWEDLAEFSELAAGAVTSRADLMRAVAGSAALVHVWPTAHAHPIESAGKPVIRPMNRRADMLVRDALAALVKSRNEPSTTITNPLDAQLVWQQIRRSPG